MTSLAAGYQKYLLANHIALPKGVQQCCLFVEKILFKVQSIVNLT
jgi:hypothetical protein